jgi:hypothetical protein
VPSKAKLDRWQVRLRCVARCAFRVFAWRMTVDVEENVESAG